jgi:cyclopropane-fatty-acyl-phospholipid synthase
MNETQRPLSRTGASPEAIKSHYDMGEDFFRLVLDPDLIYSCALFEGQDDLVSAQTRKLDHHIAAANAKGAKRVLDLGCGWGAMLRRLIDHAGVTEAVGLTLSTSQAQWIREHSRPGIKVIEQDWRDHAPDEPYDAIISIGAFEHFVQKNLEPARKLAAYREFFDFCAKMLKPDGQLSLQTIAYTEPTRLHPILEQTFPESDLPLVWEPIAAAEGTFRLIAARDDGMHYFKTLNLWEKNLLKNYDEAVKIAGEAAVTEFRRYLRLSGIGFKHRICGLLRMNFVRA